MTGRRAYALFALASSRWPVGYIKNKWAPSTQRRTGQTHGKELTRLSSLPHLGKTPKKAKPAP